MVDQELAEFLDPSDAVIRATSHAVQARVVPTSGWQVNFQACEVVLSLCAMRVVDHSPFGRLAWV